MTGRFAPTPSGRMHVGNVYAMLAAWLDARSRGERMLLRIEDIDTARVLPDADRWIMDDLHWLGLDWDGEPVHQSQRLDLYRDALRALEPRLFPCFCSRADLRAASAPQEGDGYQVYPGTCRRLAAENPDEVSRRLAAGRQHSLRLAVPMSGISAVPFHPQSASLTAPGLLEERFARLFVNETVRWTVSSQAGAKVGKLGPRPGGGCRRQPTGGGNTADCHRSSQSGGMSVKTTPQPTSSAPSALFEEFDALCYPERRLQAGVIPCHPERSAERGVEGSPFVRFTDQVFGACAYDLARDIGDAVMRRADGVVSYQLAVTVDDLAQGVTSVVRGRDLLRSTALQIWIRQCLLESGMFQVPDAEQESQMPTPDMPEPIHEAGMPAANASDAVCAGEGVGGLCGVAEDRPMLSDSDSRLSAKPIPSAVHPAYAHLPLIDNAAGRRLAKRERSLDMGALRARGVTAEQVIGYCAWLLRLIPEPTPCRAADLVAGFSWAPLRADHADRCLDPADPTMPQWLAEAL